MNFVFYDIESLDNVFTCAAFDEAKNHITLFHLFDTPELTREPDWRGKVYDTILRNNLRFSGTVSFMDLKTENGIRAFAQMFGASLSRKINDASLFDPMPSEFRLVCDTDDDYDPDKHPYLMGYNSYNYDTSMCALFIHGTCIFPDASGNGHFQSITAATLREHNNMMFSQAWKSQMPKYLTSCVDLRTGIRLHNDYNSGPWVLRRNMLLSGRHIDVARLNEKQSRVGLKRLLGMLGYQIMESDKLRPGQSVIETPEQLYDLIAYNCSDVIGLRWLFQHKLYQAQFTLKRQMLNTYPELIYAKLPDKYAPDKRPAAVRNDRLCIDASSAQFASKSLCPYGSLTDIETVSFMYPSENKAKELGIPRVNVLDECRKFFYGLYPNRPDLQANFDVIYHYYKSIEGKNFNDSKAYDETYADPIEGMPDELMPQRLSDIPKANTFLPYYDKDGNPTSCYVIFSTGGIHGAEYNKALYDADIEAYNAACRDYEYAKSVYPNPVDLRKAKTITMPDGRELPYKYFLSSPRIADSVYKEIAKPELYTMKDGKLSLNKRYNYTSVAMANHEDFKSYYPNLLRMMEAFYNVGLGYDRYAEVFDQKEDYGKKMKDKTIDKAQRDLYSVLREGTKLILNSASGAADAAFENNIRANNQIISMRIIGQLFSWRIGQAQTYYGASVISTNTDGLYSVMEEKQNNAILEQESANIGVEIEPEPLFLISKDTNNRMELTPDFKVTGASGATLGCRNGPNPAKALAHPAIIDWALGEYLIEIAKNQRGLTMESPFNEELGMEILMRAHTVFKPVQFMTMMQNILAASVSSDTYPFGYEDNELTPASNIVMLQHYNRLFYMKDGTPGTYHLKNASAKKLTPAVIRRRIKNGEARQQNDITALKVLRVNGVTEIEDGREAALSKITNLEPEWSILIQNKDLNYLTPEEHRFLIENLDYNRYLSLLRQAYVNSWCNTGVGHDDDETDVVDDNVA